MEYISQVIIIIVALLSNMFNEKGEWQKLSWLSGALILFALFSGGISMYSNYISQEKIVQQDQLLQKEKEVSSDLRGFLLATNFAKHDSLTDGFMFISMPLFDVDENGETETTANGVSEPTETELKNQELRDVASPFIDHNVQLTEINYNIPDLAEYNYRISSNSKDKSATAKVDHYYYDKKTCILKRGENSQEFVAQDASSCKFADNAAYNLSVDFAPTTALVIRLPKSELFWKIFSRIQHYHAGDPLYIGGANKDNYDYGSIKIHYRTLDDATKSLKNITKTEVGFKFFGSIAPKQKKSDCYTALLLQIKTEVSLVGQVIELKFGRIDKYDLSMCEPSPI